MQGETDFQSAGLDIQEFPLYKSNMSKGDYSVYMWPNPHGTNGDVAFNQSYNEDPALGKLIRTTEFRQALSYALNRESIRDTYFIGVGKPTAGSPNPNDGFYPGDDVANKGSTANGNASTQVDGEVMKAGVKYVTGDMTLQVGVVSGTAQDSITIGTAGTTEDSYDKTSASVSYAVASGVTAILGYSTVDSSDEGTSDATDGSSWYIGANMAF